MKLAPRYAARAAVAKALAHPTRLFIVDQLVKGERCVCELTAMVGVDISTVSKHLSLLRNAGLVTVERRGASMFYSLKCPCVTDFFACVDKVISNQAREQMALAG
jgi:DNA-binding transcriptional ArsR family regulator